MGSKKDNDKAKARLGTIYDGNAILLVCVQK